MATGIISGAQGVGAPAPDLTNPTDVGLNGPTLSPASLSSATATPQVAVPAQITNQSAWQTTPDQTVSGQVANITAQGSPIQTQARTAALQGMNARGLLNSSIAQTAGQSAVIQSALPIAAADAAQASKVAGYNTDTANQANTANVASQNQTNLANLQRSSAQEIANIEAQYKNLTQGSSSAASILNNAQAAISAIVTNTTMDADAKTRAIADIKTSLSNSMNLIGGLSGDLDLGSYVQ